MKDEEKLSPFFFLLSPNFFFLKINLKVEK